MYPGKHALIASMVVLAFLIFSGAAIAQLSYNCYRDFDGDCSFSKTKDGSDNTIVVACDRARNGYATYAHHMSRAGLEGFTYDYSGAYDGDCGRSGVYESGIRWHETCTDLTGHQDPCSDRQYH